MSKHQPDCICRECFRADTYICPRVLRGTPLEPDELEETSLWGDILDGLWTLFALIGMFAAICVVAGYAWYRSAP